MSPYIQLTVVLLVPERVGFIFPQYFLRRESLCVRQLVQVRGLVETAAGVRWCGGEGFLAGHGDWSFSVREALHQHSL